MTNSLRPFLPCHCLPLFVAAFLPLTCQLSGQEVAPQAPTDWLVNPAPFKATIREDIPRRELVLENGLIRRTLRLTPNATTIDFQSLVTGEQLLRAVGPEALVTLNGAEFPIGGLEGQPLQNYLKAEWIDKLRPIPNAYQFVDWREEPLAARFAWKKRPEWLSRDLPWPAPGKQVVLSFAPPADGAAELKGRVVFSEPFVTKLKDGWKTKASARHERSSFENEGKPGEIYALPDTSVYAERPWPAEATSVEVTLDAGDDTLSNAWGPGMALLASDRAVTFLVRPNQQCYEVNGSVLEHKFDRAKPATLRIRLDKGQAICEGRQGEQPFQRIAVVDCPKQPTTFRVGKVGRNGDGKDYPDAKGDKLVRSHILQVTFRAAEPADVAAQPRQDLPEIQIRYAIYDGIPLLEKWLVVKNTSAKPVRVNKTIVETLKVQENESATEPNINWEFPSLYVETDYAFLAMNGKSANKQAVKWLPDRSYGTQVSYPLETPCLLEVAPEFGPDVDVAPGDELTSIRSFELLRDGTDRERRGLAQRRMYRTIAPWTQENPVMVHLISNDPAAIRKIIDQGAEVGVEMIILSFGSGMNMESRDPKYQAVYKEVADYARSKGIVLGAYSLLASRGAGTAADNCRGGRVRYGVMPCLGARWGHDYLAQLKSFMKNTGFAILEHDGSYPGDTCACLDHPFHRGLEDSQWVQHQAISEFYQWCRAEGIYLNIPDWYYLNGSNKCAMNYKENNWSLPRAEQEIIERQNIFDGTWEKTSSMGWMFVPLTQYHGGGAAASIEPLHEHLDHYEARLSNLFGAGVQACYRGPRIYDTDTTKALVKKWITFYKQHREVLDADLIHLRRPDGRDWDGFVHVNPQGTEKALAFFYNPLAAAIEREIRVPLHYAGLTNRVQVSVEGVSPSIQQLDKTDTATVRVKIPARGRTWLLFGKPIE
ncbi:hypothetical protein [Anatilimnocola floriformis]|uniref:hypothetical protein n=1 Tax=Anatilimnocola floriformis TaxID=2948575 RepID=UPI0020C2356C|nr:hypothetical protein [Anatilimnocola floriformis]